MAVKARVILHLEHQPEHFKVAPPLADIIGVREDTRVGVVAAFWNYIKLNGLQDKVHPTTIKLDQKLMQVRTARPISQPNGVLSPFFRFSMLPKSPSMLSQRS